jgi:uncharacterized Rossmann fold enzyme
MRHRPNLQEEIMSNSRCYVVGERDMWVIQCAPSEQARCTSCSKAIAFAIGAAQKLGMRGERAHVCVLDNDGRLRSKWTFNRHWPKSARPAIS